MTENVTNLTLVILTLASAAASVLALARLRAMMMSQATSTHPADAQPTTPRKLALNVLVGAVALGAVLLLVFRWSRAGHGWNPLVAHVDGLLLIASLLAAVGLYIQSRPRMGGLAAFGLPLLTLILAWAICASMWTYRPFQLDTLSPVWGAVHLAGVYLGTLGCAVAAVTGGLFLYVERQFKAKRNPRGLMRLASLESIEQLIQQSATLGFALLTLGLISGVVIIQNEAEILSAGWWYSPKIVLAFLAWGTYAVVMNARYATAFRGRRAAWLAIGGFVLLLVVYGIVTSGPSNTPSAAPQSSQAKPQTTSANTGRDASCASFS